MDLSLSTFVVHRPGSWVVAPLSGEAVEVSADDVCRLLADGDGDAARPWSGAVPRLRRHRDEGPFTTAVIPVPTIVMAVEGLHLVLDSTDGVRFLLDATDVRLVDAVVAYRDVGDLIAVGVELGLDESESARRVARLVDASALQVFVPDETAAPPSPVVDASPQRGAVAAPSGEPIGAIDGDGGSDRIPVYAIWHETSGPLLALGLLTASARAFDGGALNEVFEIRRPESASSFLADVAQRTGPAILLCSDYVWSINENLATARAARRMNPDLVVIHGGPSCPKYEGDAEQFLIDHGDVAHVLVRGEGEIVLAQVLTVLSRCLPAIDGERLRAIGGLTFVDDDGRVVRTDDQARISDLDALPSPYLTGEFDGVSPEAWNQILAIETNRGCPYGCTFCDWGSSTLSRIRKFDLERVTAEIEWATALGVSAIDITDANFGIMSRDVETARRLADARRRTGFPRVVAFYPAKNTTKHLLPIMDLLLDAGISSAASLSLQTTDPATLENLDRTNISVGHFVALAAAYRRKGHPLLGDLLLGMPGQTVETYRRDLQFMLDHEIMARTWPLQLLPNAPMNAPEYRAEHGIVSDERNLIMSANTFSTDDRARMLRLRRIDLVCERYGLLRHVLRLLQWDHGIEATMVMMRLLDMVDTDPGAYPVLAWVMQNFDLYPTAAVGWHEFYDEVRRFVESEFEVGIDGSLETVIAVQLMLMPAPGRSFPATISLAHDYVAYYRDGTASLFRDGAAGAPSRPLSDFGPAEFTVEADPLRLCRDGLQLPGDTRSETMQGEFYIGTSVAFELVSPLLRLLPWIGANGIPAPYLGPEPAADPSLDDLPVEDAVSVHPVHTIAVDVEIRA